jgi:hypothetical protein
LGPVAGEIITYNKEKHKASDEKVKYLTEIIQNFRFS